jgi:extradiol dioxygenase family protein
MSEGIGQEVTAIKKAAREVETVKMQDGREVEFVGKRKLLKETIIDGSDVTVRLDFRNGETRSFSIPDALLLQFAGHGAEQKLGDETAGTDDVDDMVLDVDSLLDRLNKGEWSMRKEGGSNAGTSVLLQALVEFSGKSAEDIRAFLKDKSQAEKLALRMSAQLKPIVEAIEAKKAAKNSHVDTDSLLAGL